jgi:hypothetical protein
VSPSAATAPLTPTSKTTNAAPPSNHRACLSRGNRTPSRCQALKAIQVRAASNKNVLMRWADIHAARAVDGLSATMRNRTRPAPTKASVVMKNKLHPAAERVG